MSEKDLIGRIGAYVDEVWPSVLEDIAALVSVPSIADAKLAEPGSPHGPAVHEALTKGLAIAERLGLAPCDCDGWIGYADLPGASPRQVATIAHVDVVPAGEGWSGSPWEVREREGYLLGRGVIDDKGPAVLSMYAAHWFAREVRGGRELPYTLRVILGSDEEVGMTDVGYYLEHHDQPAFLFTPDAEFPVCCGEKGRAAGSFVSGELAAGSILAFEGGTVGNAVPGLASCVVALGEGVEASGLPPVEGIDAEAVDMPAGLGTPAGPDTSAGPDTFSGSENQAGLGTPATLGIPTAPEIPAGLGPGGESATEVRKAVRLTAHGKGGHASLPAGTVNAIGMLVGYLLDNNLVAGSEREYLELLARVFASTDGSALGIDATDDLFEPLTCIGGTIRLEGGRLVQTIDCRYPKSTTGGEITGRLGSLAAAYGATFTLESDMVPFYIDPANPCVTALVDAYNEFTGKNAEPFTIGGGTYARHFANAVSFGPEEPGEPAPEWVGPMHGADEGVSIELLKRSLKIYIYAFEKLMALQL